MGQSVIPRSIGDEQSAVGDPSHSNSGSLAEPVLSEVEGLGVTLFTVAYRLCNPSPMHRWGHRRRAGPQ